MALFRFVFEEDALLDDITPVEFPDYEAAIDAAKKAARETLIDAVIEGSRSDRVGRSYLQ
ncbi:hypothetical protein N8E89_25090 (plasmid) [Phyllobacterium sp. A18/5-2]|uniref:DUF6894 family protein n=1 Tax=Phyllobacterium sp. A18/5-2 TaxID=2978392 RepID=UPI0021C5CA6A|nr:hypothetical protein [Phyllobacterium sp. A18/5-2]UXN66408.1 hypothetical protein N8E89_25090 [Phyllobacterium sp. A18/5-2]